MIIKDFTEPELDVFREKCNFSEGQYVKKGDIFITGLQGNVCDRKIGVA